MSIEKLTRPKRIDEERIQTKAISKAFADGKWWKYCRRNQWY